jgi:hypothetical protein
MKPLCFSQYSCQSVRKFFVKKIAIGCDFGKFQYIRYDKTIETVKPTAI